MNFEQVLNLAAEHPEFVTFVALFVLYWARGAMPRQPPMDPFWLKVWELENKILSLPWDRWLGKPHLPGSVVPEFDMVGWLKSQQHSDDANDAP